MAKLAVPSLQHLSRNWHNDPAYVAKVLVRLAEHPPLFSYEPLFDAVRDMLVLGVPYDQISEGIKRGVRREGVRNNFLEVLPLIHRHFDQVSPTFVQAIDRRLFPVARGLMVPFDPPLLYGFEGRIHFPWFSFWRRNPLGQERLSLFVTLVDDLLMQDPDLENCKFEILDFSVSSASGQRELEVIDAAEIPRVSVARKSEMLAIFAEGYFKAKSELAGTVRSKDKSAADDDVSVTPEQTELFGSKP